MIITCPIPLSPPSKPFYQSILDSCLTTTEEDPEKMAFINSSSLSDCLTFSQLRTLSLSFASWLQQNGFKKGDVILVCLHNSWQFVVSVLGAWSAGLVVSPASPQFTHFELSLQLSDSTARAVITDEECLSTVIKSTESCKVSHIICSSPHPIAGTVWLSDTLHQPNTLSPPSIDMDKDLIVLPYSSGTTGTPKGVMISHLNYAYMLGSYKARYDADYRARGLDGFIPPPTTITFLPLYHAMGMFGMFFHVSNGTTQIMMDRFRMEPFLKHVQDHQIMGLAMVPSLVLALAASPLLDSYDLSSLLVIACGSAPMAQSIVEKLKKRLPDVNVLQGYGMTELSVASHIASMESPDGSVGVLVPGTEMKVVSDSGRVCGPNEEGELWLRGPQIMKGYWRREKETREAFDKDGFMRTGDIVYYDENHFTFVCDRIKELIKVHGKQVAPAELESLILSVPTVHDCCVVGIPDDVSGEVPTAFVVVGESPVDQEKLKKDIESYVNEKVAHYKRLRGGIFFVSSLPRTPTGKLLRRKIRQQFLKKKAKI